MGKAKYLVAVAALAVPLSLALVPISQAGASAPSSSQNVTVINPTTNPVNVNVGNFPPTQAVTGTVGIDPAHNGVVNADLTSGLTSGVQDITAQTDLTLVGPVDIRQAKSLGLVNSCVPSGHSGACDGFTLVATFSAPGIDYKVNVPLGTPSDPSYLDLEGPRGTTITLTGHNADIYPAQVRWSLLGRSN